MGFSIPIVRGRGVIIRKGHGKGCSFPGPRIGTWGTRPHFDLNGHCLQSALSFRQENGEESYRPNRVADTLRDGGRYP